MIFGIGTDVLEISRIKSAVDRNGEKFLNRVFTQGEQAYCLGQRDPYPGLAARFAAKEAVFKALGTGVLGLGWTEVEVKKYPGGAPAVVLHGAALRFAQGQGVTKIKLSISHSRQMAVAFAVALKGSEIIEGSNCR